MPRYKTLNLVVESQSISNSDRYDPCSTSNPRNNNLILAEERTRSRTQEQPPTRVPVYNVNEDKKEEVTYGCREG
jgi:hypothetical protein